MCIIFGLRRAYIYPYGSDLMRCYQSRVAFFCMSWTELGHGDLAEQVMMLNVGMTLRVAFF